VLEKEKHRALCFDSIEIGKYWRFYARRHEKPVFLLAVHSGASKFSAHAATKLS
jgi:hypothetical protein